MAANDCFELGLHLYKSKNFQYAILWFEEAIRRFDRISNAVLIDTIESYIALIHYEEGELKKN